MKDIEIEELFHNTDFGDPTNNSLEMKKQLLRECLIHQTKGLWSGRTIYSMMIHAQLLVDGKSNSLKSLTDKGRAFLNSFNDDSDVVER